MANRRCKRCAGEVPPYSPNQWFCSLYCEKTYRLYTRIPGTKDDTAVDQLKKIFGIT